MQVLAPRSRLGQMTTRPNCTNLEVKFSQPGWRNWQTQRTQNPPVLSTLGVRFPLPAPALLGSIGYGRYLVLPLVFRDTFQGRKGSPMNRRVPGRHGPSLSSGPCRDSVGCAELTCEPT